MWLAEISNANSPIIKDSLEIPEMYISRILISGNEVTDERVILREISLKEGDLLELEKLKEDVNRLYNLGLFTKVEIQPLPISTDSIIILYELTESIYFLPIPQGGIKENSFKKIWGGLNVIYRNFRGMNETIGLSFGVGYEPFIFAHYKNPWIGNSDRYFINTRVGYSRKNRRYIDNGVNTSQTNIESLPTYKLNDFYTEVSVGRYFMRDFSVNAELGYNIYEVSADVTDITSSQDGTDRYFTLMVDANYDSRDLRAYPTKGVLYDVSLQRFGFTKHSVDYTKASVEYRRFIPFEIFKGFELIWGNRISTSLSFGGNIPKYLKENFGQSEFIRGWDDIYMSGDSKTLFSSELRIPLIKPDYIKGKDLPLIKNLPGVKDYVYKYGLYLTMFFDFGTVWERETPLSQLQFRNGYGIGMNFILPFDFIARVDFAWRKNSSVNLLYSLRASF